ncbi:MAG: hypothetical protein LUG64_08365 [Clostridiales bacterium]|nr:hypothetical protein [Clostridiales bacterium]
MTNRLPLSSAQPQLIQPEPAIEYHSFLQNATKKYRNRIIPFSHLFNISLKIVVGGVGGKFTNPNVDKNKALIYNTDRKRALSDNGQSPSGEEVTAGVASRGGYFLLLYAWMTRLHALMITNRSCKTSEVVIRQAPFPGAIEVAPIKTGDLTAAVMDSTLAPWSQPQSTTSLIKNQYVVV